MSFVEQILLKFKADTSDAKAKIRELSGEERKRAQESLKNLEAENKSLDNKVAMLGKVALAVGVVAGAAKFLWDDWKFRAEKARLETASFGVDLKALGDAALGTKSQMELLGDAAKMNHGIFRLTSDQMAMVETAMIGLTRRGHDAAEVQKKVLDAVTNLKIDGMQDLGLVIDKAGLSMDSAADRFKLLERLLLALNDVSKTVGKGQLTMAEQIEQASSRARDSWDEFLHGDSIMRAYFDPKAREAFIRDTIQRGYGAKSSGKSVEDFDADMVRAIALVNKNAQAASSYATQYPKFGHELEMPEMNLGAMRDQARSVARALADKRRELSNRVAKDLTDDLLKELEENAQSVGELVGDLDGGVSAEGYSIRGGENQRDLTFADSVQGKNQSRLEKMFGPIDEFDAYKSAFEGLSTVVQGSFDAWITGSASVGEAVRRLAGDVLRAGAVQLMGEAIKHGVYAVGSLAFGDFRGAAQHGVAAGKALAGAAALGVLAKSVGGSSGGSSGGGSGSGAAPTGSAAGAGTGAGGGNTYVISYGDSFAGDSPLMRQRNAKKMVESALGSPGVK